MACMVETAKGYPITIEQGTRACRGESLMASGRPKITVVGAGNVGASVAQYAVEKELGDVVLVDVDRRRPARQGARSGAGRPHSSVRLDA